MKTKRDVCLYQILNVTLKVSGLRKSVFNKKCRFHRIIRNLYFLVSNENTDISLDLIGKPFKLKRDLVFKSIKSVSKDIDTNDIVKLIYDTIKKEVKNVRN
ncbi:MAG: hypothetical protein M0R17_04285 [Candidatus Omnitrophica bacterium]|jgi:hypothetical protein|nr:hypothetical protein [Candidatus Omnitrophota bacterium]